MIRPLAPLLFLLPSCLVSTRIRSAFPSNVSDAWDGSNVLRLRLGKASIPQCTFIVIRDGCLPDSYFPQVAGSGGKEHVVLTEAVFEVPGNKGCGANFNDSHMMEVVVQARQIRRLSSCVMVVTLSDDPVFLGAFAEASDKHRLMVWETKLLVVTRMATLRLWSLLENYWSFSMMNTMFLTPEKRSIYRWQGYVHLPYTPTGSQVQRVGGWRRGNDLLVDGERLFPQKYRNFHGMNVNVTWGIVPPYWIPLSASRSDSLRGRDTIIIDTIGEALNFSIHPLPFKGNLKWMDPLLTREALIRPIILPIMQHMVEKFEITYLVEPSTLAFAMAKPTLKPTWQSLFYPLSPVVWVSISVAVIVVYVVLYMMIFEGDDMRQGAWLVLKQVVGTLLDEAIPGELPHRSSTRIALTAWLIFAFIVGTVYRSNLTACLTVPTYPPRAESLEDLFHMGIKITVMPEMEMFHKAFKESGLEVLETLADGMEYVQTTVDGLNQTITENKAYLYERLHMEVMIAEYFTEEDGSTPLYVTQKTFSFMSEDHTFLLARNAPFKSLINQYLLVFHEAGLIKKWTVDVMRDIKREAMKNKVQSEVKTTEKNEKGVVTLTLVHMQGLFVLYFAGGMVSLVAFLSENASLATHTNRLLY